VVVIHLFSDAPFEADRDLSMGILFSRLSDKQAHIYGLVFSSGGIPHHIIRYPSYWAVDVPDHFRRAAVTAVYLYLVENAVSPAVVHSRESFAVKTYSAIFAILVLSVIHWTVQPGYEHQVFVDAYGADSGAILAGQLYRCVTALMFHTSWSHLLANLFGLTLFGTAVAAFCGWGVGWLLILTSGALGNFLNACWYGPDHMSVGASTAVFAAVGLCASLTFAVRIRRSEPMWRAWIPLGAGLALLAFLGASPKTDLMAHLFGFTAGLGFGGLYSWRSARPLSWHVQLAASMAAGGILVASWMAGMTGA
jgi:rhomboid protease GluP